MSLTNLPAIGKTGDLYANTTADYWQSTVAAVRPAHSHVSGDNSVDNYATKTVALCAINTPAGGPKCLESIGGTGLNRFSKKITIKRSALCAVSMPGRELKRSKKLLKTHLERELQANALSATAHLYDHYELNSTLRRSYEDELAEILVKRAANEPDSRVVA